MGATLPHLALAMALLTGCGVGEPSPSAPTTHATAHATDPWTVSSAGGVTQGEPDARFVPPPEPRTGHDSESASEAPDPTSPPPSSSPADSLARQMPALQGSIRRCFNTALQRDPNLRGPAPPTIDFGPDGKVTRVLFDGKPPRPGSLEECIAGGSSGASCKRQTGRYRSSSRSRPTRSDDLARRRYSAASRCAAMRSGVRMWS